MPRATANIRRCPPLPLTAGGHTIQIKATIKDPFDPTHPVVGTINTTLSLVVAP